MLWFQNSIFPYTASQTLFNSSILITPNMANALAASFRTIFSNLTSLESELSSIRYYPIKFLDSPEGRIISQKIDDDNLRGRSVLPATFATLGQFYVKPKFNNFADYKGYTFIKVFLPVVGYVDVDVNECMGKWLQFRISIDFKTGMAKYIIGVSEEEIDAQIPANARPYMNSRKDNDFRVIAVYDFRLGVDIPITTTGADDLYRNMALSGIKTVMSLASKGAASSSSSTTTSESSYEDYAINEDTSRLRKVAKGHDMSVKTVVHNKPVNKLSGVADVVNSSIDVLNRSYPANNSDRGAGNITDYFFNGKIKVLVYRPRLVDEGEYYGSLYGYPLGKFKKLNKVTGFTIVNNIQFYRTAQYDGAVDRITKKEIAMLEEAFSNGVIL